MEDEVQIEEYIEDDVIETIPVGDALAKMANLNTYMTNAQKQEYGIALVSINKELQAYKRVREKIHTVLARIEEEKGKKVTTDTELAKIAGMAAVEQMLKMAQL